MKTRSILIVSGIILSIILIVVVRITIAWKSISDAKPRKPVVEVEERYDVGWWSNQEKMVIDTLILHTVKSELSMFNAESLISYTIKGSLKSDSGSRPKIDFVHVSQRFTDRFKLDSIRDPLEDRMDTPEALIEFTPVVKVKFDDTYKGDRLPFEFTNEMLIESFHFGESMVRFKAGKSTQHLVVLQTK